MVLHIPNFEISKFLTLNKQTCQENFASILLGPFFCFLSRICILVQHLYALRMCFQHKYRCFRQGCGSGSQLDPDSIGPVDPDPYSESGSRRAKITHKSRNFFLKFKFWSVGWTLLWAAGFFCNLDILYEGLGIGKLQFLIKKKFNFFSVF